VGSLSAYIAWINRFPTLTAEQEHALATRLKETGDLEAARRLVMSHLRFVVSMTRRYLGYGFPHEDLIQEGTVGLVKAVKLFDPSKGVRLISFAIHWIKASVHDYLIQNWRVVKVATTKAQRKLFFNLHRMLKQTNRYASRLSDDEAQRIANDLGVKINDVRIMEVRLQRKDKSLDYIADDDTGSGSGSSTNTYQTIHAEIEPFYFEGQPMADDPAQHIESLDSASSRLRRLHQSLEQLKPRLRDILEKRWLSDKKSTLKELATRYNISIERVRQLEKQALSALQQAMTSK